MNNGIRLYSLRRKVSFLLSHLICHCLSLFFFSHSFVTQCLISAEWRMVLFLIGSPIGGERDIKRLTPFTLSTAVYTVCAVDNRGLGKRMHCGYDAM